MKSIWHPYHIWECYKAGFYDTTHPLYTLEEGKDKCYEFLSDLYLFERALKRVISEWPKSCEHFLTKPSVNKIAWLGQASACIELGLPSKFRGGFNLLSIEQQKAANKLAGRYYSIWKNRYENMLINGEYEDTPKEYQMKFRWN